MKHLDLLKANKVDNTSTAVYHWINKMPANEAESNWLKKTFDGLYKLEQDYVLDANANDDKETIAVMQRTEATSKAWADKIIAIHDREEPEEEEEIIIPIEQPVEKIKEDQPQPKDTPSLASKLKDYLGSDSSKVISKRKLIEFGYKGRYPTTTGVISIENQFKLKREKRTSALSFTLLPH